MRPLHFAIALLAFAMLPAAARAEQSAAAQALLRAYPDALERVEANTVVFKNGLRLPLDDGRGEKPFDEWLAEPDIEDMFRIPYPAGAEPAPPPAGSDPGRARNAAFFAAMYGDCAKGEVARNLVAVDWLPARKGGRLQVTRVNGVAERLAAVSREIDHLPASFTRYLVPAAGTYVCRSIAGTERTSAHGYGIAIDISTAHAHYWRWSKEGAAGKPVYRNAIPMEIVRIFEKHGFIWGGRWYHYDTMHFEYRPELLVGRR